MTTDVLIAIGVSIFVVAGVLFILRKGKAPIEGSGNPGGGSTDGDNGDSNIGFEETNK
jgi:hypothetical protein